MTGILRQQSKIFAENAPIRLVTVFRTAGDNPTQSKTPDVIQNETYSIGWINADNTGNLIPYAEDMNGVLYTLSYNTSYLFEKGMPEYSPEQTYYENSFCQYGGYLYRCKVDETLNIVPTNTNYWDKIETDAYSATNIGTGEGFYASMSGTQFRFKTLIAADDSVVVDSGDDYVSVRAVAQVPSITASSPLSYSNGALSIQAADSSQGGYLTAADWASFNGKLSSTIFSNSNDWTGVNKFSSGQFTNILALGKYSETASDRYVILQSYSTQYAGSLTNWGALGYYDSQYTFAPITNGSYSLGTSNYKWGSIFVNDVYTDWIKPTAFSSSLSQVGIGEAASEGGLPHHPVLLVKSYLDNGSQFDVLVPGKDVNSTILTFIGTDSQPWSGGCFFALGANNLSPLTTGGAIGSSSKYYANGYITNLFTQYIKATDEKSLLYMSGGSVDLRWDINGDTATGYSLMMDPTTKYALRPNLQSAIALGTSSYGFRSIHLRYTNSQNPSNGDFGIYNDIGYLHLAGKGGTYGGVVIYGLNNDELFSLTALGIQPKHNISNKVSSMALGSDSTRWNKVYTGSGGVDTSDRRLKENIEPLEHALDKLNTIGVHSFTWTFDSDHIQYGLIAQDEIERNSELIDVPSDYNSEDSDGGVLGVYTNNVLYLAVRAIQELSAEVEILKQQLREVRNED